MVENIGFTQADGGGRKQQINFLMRDNENSTINCTLWETYAAQLIKFNRDHVGHSGPTIILLQYAKIKEAGKYPLSVSNTYNVTKLLLNADVSPITNFIKRPLRSIHKIQTVPSRVLFKNYFSKQLCCL